MKVLNENQKSLKNFLDTEISYIDKSLSEMRQKIKRLNEIKSNFQLLRKEIK